MCCLLEIRDLTITFPTKTCLQNASGRIHRGDRIALIGDNGAGKSTLLKTILEQHGATQELRISYLPQDSTLEEERLVWEVATDPVRAILQDLQKLETSCDSADYQAAMERLNAAHGFEVEHRVEALLSRFDLLRYRHRPVHMLSGGERMRLSWVCLLSTAPDLILLDEPTNHLDSYNRGVFMDFLDTWKGASVIVTHDSDLLHAWPEKIWSIHDQALHLFNGNYSGYLLEKRLAEEKEREEFEELKRTRKKLAVEVQEELTRRDRTTAYGKKKYESQPKMVRNAAIERAERTSGRAHVKRLFEQKEEAIQEYRDRRKPRIPLPRFHFTNAGSVAIEIIDGSIGYEAPIATGINLSISPGDRIALQGNNGSGKTTFMRALMDDPRVRRGGVWRLPAPERIGYLDQHYHLLDRSLTVEATLEAVRPDWTAEERERHLGAFLFLHLNTHQQQVKSLSEGEKARLALAVLAANAPDVLLLDEVTNNLDLRTKEHLIAVLQSYPGTLIINSHEKEFLNAIGVDIWFEIDRFKRKQPTYSSIES